MKTAQNTTYFLDYKNIAKSHLRKELEALNVEFNSQIFVESSSICQIFLHYKYPIYALMNCILFLSYDRSSAYVISSLNIYVADVCSIKTIINIYHLNKKKYISYLYGTAIRFKKLEKNSQKTASLLLTFSLCVH